MHGLGPSEFTGLFVKVHMFAGAAVWDDMLIIVCHVRVERVVISGRRARRSSAAGFTEPVGSGPETLGSGPIGPRTGFGSGRSPTGPNLKFEFKLKNEKVSQNSRKYFKVYRI
jgi:hypothetical protein